MLSGEEFLQRIGILKKRVDDLLFDLKKEGISIRLKEDKSIITQFDEEISKLAKNTFSDNCLCFFSEEDHQDLTFPALILDPIDGTREFSKLIPECCVSLAVMSTNSLKSDSFYWLYNPLTKEEICSQSISSFNNDHSEKILVSRSEYKANLFSHTSNVTPIGSIAYKLGILACKQSKAVVSLRPKNIWDIAAGTLACDKKNVFFFEQGRRITVLDKKKFQPPPIWCKNEDFHYYNELFPRFV